MKRTLMIVSLLLSTLLLGGCHEEIERRILALKEDVNTIEQRINTINESIQSLSALVEALEKNEPITSSQPWTLGTWSGYQVTFTSGTVLTLRNGTDGVAPIVGVNYHETYETYYWTIQMGESGAVTWMTSSTGQRVRATSIVPQLKIEDGVWWYSFDGNNWNKTYWGAAQGLPGEAFFSSVDTSDPYYVTFILADGSRFQLPTQEAFDELNQQCSEINSLFMTYVDLIKQTDSSIFVKSVVEFEEDGVTGSRLTFEDGHVLTIRNGFDDRDSVLLSAKAYTDGKYYWVFRNRSDEEYQWLRYNGEMICVTMENITPYIGITDSLGQLYFTVAYGNGPAEMMRDSKGNPVVATGKLVPDFFSGADVSDPSFVVLTLADGTQVKLPRTRLYTPSMTTSVRTSYVEADKKYTYQLLLFVKDTLQQKAPCADFEEYQRVSGTHIDAIAVDDGYVNDIVLVSMYADTTHTAKRGIVAYDFIFDVQFTTGPLSQWNTTYPSRYAIFLTWGDKSIMKVVEFTRAILAKAVTLSADKLDLTVGQTTKLTATVTPSNTTETVSWKTSDAKIATVSDKGEVKALAPGTCTITATAGRYSATCAVTVKAATP